MSDLRKIGKYILLEEQEQTGVGRTWRGAELANGRIDKYLLVEFINEQLASDDGFIDQYLSQSLVAAKLEHPNILRKVNSIHESGQLVTAFEFHEGFTLQKVLSKCQNDGFPLHIDHALLVASKLLSALTYAKSKHLTHGFIHPTMVFVTHEGEIKLKGFALSSAMRQFRSGALPLGDEFSKYLPPGMSLASEDRDQLDIYGCGAILFEMIAGEGFHAGPTGNPGARIDQAVTASSGEPIPPKIAAILHKALNPSTGEGYSDIQQMGKEMEELLYSGEYSPTTFNLAFFMHSAFRGEMEAFSERIAKEREIDFSGHAISAMEAPTVADKTPEPAPPAPAPSAAPRGQAVQQPVPARKEKSKLPMIIGGLVALAAVIVAAVFLMPKGEKAEDRFSKRAAELQAEGAESEKALLEQQREELRLQNLALMQQLKEQSMESQPEESDPAEDVESQAEPKNADASSEEMKEIEAQRAQLERERKAFEAMREEKLRELEALKKEEPAKQAVVEQQEEKAPEKAAETTNQVAKAEEKAPEQNDAGTTEPAKTNTQAASDAAEPDTTTSRPIDVPKETAPKEERVEEQPIARPPARRVPPVEGQLVPLDDPDLTLPTLLVPYKSQQVPTKAVKAGVVRRDRTIPFIMRILVDEEGEVEDAELFRSPLKDGDNDYGMVDKAIRTAKKMKFSNPTKMGVNVKVWMYITVNFTSK